jgi:hypothetical protein
MTLLFFTLFICGLGMLVRGLISIAAARAAWEARSVPGIANVTACRPVPNPETGELDPNAFAISVRYADTRGQSHTADLPAAQEFRVGDPIDVRFDPKHPATVRLKVHFAGSSVPAVLVAFGGFLMITSLICSH